MLKQLALVCSLALAGCVSNSQYKEDTAKLQKELQVEKKRLAKTQEVACGIAFQQCILIVSLQAAFSGQEVDPSDVENYCGAEANACMEYLK